MYNTSDKEPESSYKPYNGGGGCIIPSLSPSQTSQFIKCYFDFN